MLAIHHSTDRLAVRPTWRLPGCLFTCPLVPMTLTMLVPVVILFF